MSRSRIIRASNEEEAQPDMAAVALEDRFDFGSREYLELFASSSATAFQHPLWLQSLFEKLAPERGAEKIVVTARDPASNRLILVLPLVRRRKRGIVLLEASDLGVSDYAAPVAAPGLMLGPELQMAIRSTLPSHDLLRIRPIRAEHLPAWQACLGGDASRLDFSAHAAPLGGDVALWRDEKLSPGFRRRLDRKKKRFLKQPEASVRLLTEAGEIRSAISGIARLRAGRFNPDMIQNGYVEDFYADIAERGQQAGFARTYAISVGGETIGYAFGIAHAGCFNYLLIGCDYERHGRHSPGLILYDFMIEDWISEGGSLFDFTIGDESFKMEFGTEATAMYELSRRQTWRGRIAAAAFAFRERLRRPSKASGIGEKSGEEDRHGETA
ncbi:GNAT family N-acetyltransferase [Chelativorans sp.]|uniref:GNAT family N-acetyltransferase n=1 Tax=Chelativorans sp. TaxID=2203393 RepID=UPI002811845A|nr:GNAT family N-acetyltransferase [Chelativorans sp.]